MRQHFSSIYSGQATTCGNAQTHILSANYSVLRFVKHRSMLTRFSLSGASGEEDTSPVPFGSYVYDRRPDLPVVFQTKQEVKRSKKKQEKLDRRAQRQQFSAAALVPPAQPTAVATGLYYGKFEQHTTGYGSRMLAKWGFSGQGSGLGRDQQGIAEPIAAVIRPKKLGLGH